MLEIWYNNKTNETLILSPEPNNLWYTEFRAGSYWISGINLYWLLSNGFKRRLK